MNAQELAHKTLGDWIMGPMDMGLLERAIAGAITQARQQALDEAAQAVEDALYNTRSSCSDDAIHEGLQAIRALKDK